MRTRTPEKTMLCVRVYQFIFNLTLSEMAVTYPQKNAKKCKGRGNLKLREEVLPTDINV